MDHKQFSVQTVQRAQKDGIFDIDKCMVEYFKAFPMKALSHFSNIKKNLKDIEETKENLQRDRIQSPFQLHYLKFEGKLKRDTEWVFNDNIFKKKLLF